MKNWKKLLSIVLAVSLVLGAVSLAGFAAFPGYDSDGEQANLAAEVQVKLTGVDGDGEIKEGSKLTFQAVLNHPETDLAAWSGLFAYDPAVLKFDSVRKSSAGNQFDYSESALIANAKDGLKWSSTIWGFGAITEAQVSDIIGMDYNKDFGVVGLQATRASQNSLVPANDEGTVLIELVFEVVAMDNETKVGFLPSAVATSGFSMLGFAMADDTNTSYDVATSLTKVELGEASLNTAKLRELITACEALLENEEDYVQDSDWDAIFAVGGLLDQAKDILANSDDQDEVDDIVGKLEAAIALIKVDTSAIDDAIAELRAFAADDDNFAAYKPESVTLFKNAMDSYIAAAEAVRDNAEVTPDDVKTAVEDLNKIKDILVLRIDWQPLDDAIAELEQYLADNASVLTTKSISDCEDAIAAIKADGRYHNPDADTNDLGALMQAVEAAKDALEFKGDFEELLKLMQTVEDEYLENIENGWYSKTTADALEAAYQAAETLKNDATNATQAVIDAAAKAIDDAIAGLELLPADYTRYNNALALWNSKDESEYTTESWSASKAIVEANTLTGGDLSLLKDKEESVVNAAAAAIEQAIADLIMIMPRANYDDWYEVVADMPTELYLYTEATVSDMMATYNKIEYDWYVDRQDELDALVIELRQKIDALVAVSQWGTEENQDGVMVDLEAAIGHKIVAVNGEVYKGGPVQSGDTITVEAVISHPNFKIQGIVDSFIYDSAVLKYVSAESVAWTAVPLMITPAKDIDLTGVTAADLNLSDDLAMTAPKLMKIQSAGTNAVAETANGATTTAYRMTFEVLESENEKSIESFIAGIPAKMNKEENTSYFTAVYDEMMKPALAYRGAMEFTADLSPVVSGVKVSGSVISYHGGNDLVVELWQDNVLVYSTTVTGFTNASTRTTEFEIEGVAAGTYDLIIKKAAHLTHTVTGVVVVDEDLDLIDVGHTVSLIPGAIDADNMVGVGDLSIMMGVANYGKSITTEGVNVLCDINGDGFINLDDISIIMMAAHYNKNAPVEAFKG